ncbi:PREDICTED: cysteine-rich venom protein-like, partial [Nanorana parkeri]|uniref:cysteine-rich venom protein-like n=1 Tax=Nanorana parkeri TaxID=125878 RepID=UPI000854BA51
MLIPDPPVAVLPPCEEEFSDKKHNRTLRKRSAGRPVTLPSDIVQIWMNKPISDLYTSLEINRKIILESHNKYRSTANPTASNMLELKWSDIVMKKADVWATNCTQGHSNPAQRTIPDFKCGENVFLAPYKVPWDVVIGSWFGEIVDFKYETGSVNGAEVGHYTQLMWGTSSLMGCSVAECPNLVNRYNFVCHYCPLGNRKPTAIPYKSGKPCGDCPNACKNNLC